MVCKIKVRKAVIDNAKNKILSSNTIEREYGVVVKGDLSNAKQIAIEKSNTINDLYSDQVSSVSKVKDGYLIAINPSEAFINRKAEQYTKILDKLNIESENKAVLDPDDSFYSRIENEESMPEDFGIYYSPKTKRKKIKKIKGNKKDVSLKNAARALSKVKTNQKNILSTKLSRVMSDKRVYKSKPKKYKELSRREIRLREDIKAIEIDLSLLSSNITRYEHIEDAIIRDLEDLDNLIYSNSFSDKNTARDIIEFYSKLMTTGASPFFSDEELLKNRKEIKKYFKKFVTQALSKQSELDKAQKILVKNIEINGKTFKKELKKEFKEGIKDINYFTMLIQDAQFQIGMEDQNGYIPQLANIILEEAENRHKIRSSRDLKIINEFEAELKKVLPYKTVRGVKYYDYDIFFGKDEYGQNNRKVITRFNTDIYSKTNKKEDEWKKRMYKSYSKTDKVREKILNGIRKEKMKFYKKNYEFVNILALEEIVNDSKYSKLFKGRSVKVSSNYKSKLRDTILKSEHGYNELIEEQKRMLDEYISMEKIEKNRLKKLVSEGVISSTEATKALKEYQLENNPIDVYEQIKKSKSKNVNNYKYNSYLHKIPKRRIDGKDSGYYNNNFVKIENNDVYRRFRNFLEEYSKSNYELLHPSDKHGMSFMSIPMMKKSTRDLLNDPNLAWYQVINKSIKHLVDYIRNAAIVREDRVEEVGKINPLTGRPYPRVKLENIQFSKKSTSFIFNKEIVKIKAHLSHLKDIDKATLADLDQNVIDIFAKYLGVPNTLIDIQRAVPNLKDSNFKVTKFLRSIIQNHVIENSNQNLINTLKYNTAMMNAYSARQEVLGIQEILKDEYLKLKNPNTNKQGRPLMVDGKIISTKERSNANKQYEAWYNRVILGGYNAKEVYFNKKGEKQKFGMKYVDDVAEKVFTKLSSKAKKDEFKEVREKIEKDINEIISKPVQMRSKKEKKALERLTNIQTSIEEEFEHLSKTGVSMTQFFNRLVFAPVRFFGLGYNLRSAVTNYQEGKLANSIAASSGKYFNENDYFYAERIMGFSKLKGVTRLSSKTSPVAREHFMAAEVARILMDRYELLEDASNELQKASTTNKLDSFISNPFELTSRTEYQIQTPVAIAMMRKKKINDGKGNEISLWEAFMEGAREGNIGELGSKWNTDANKINYSDLSSDEARRIEANNKIDRSFIGEITEALVKIHGDYSRLRGNMLSESTMGKVFQTFRRWMGSQIYTKWAAEHYNIRLDKMEKGRYRSLNASTGLLLGAALSVSTGGMSLVFGSVAGAVVGNTFNKYSEVKTGLTLVEEMLTISAMTAKRVVGNPINTLSGKTVIDANTLNGPLKKYSDKMIENLESDPKGEMELENIRANVGEIASTIIRLMAMIMIKASLSDDDEDEVKIANFMMNTLNSVLDQSQAFLSPVALYNNIFSEDSLAVYRFLNNNLKIITGLIGDITNIEDDPKNKWATLFRKTYSPSIFRSQFGFESSMKKQYKKTIFDSLSWSEDTIIQKQITSMREQYKQKLKDSGLSTDAINKKLRKTYVKGKNYKKAHRHLQHLTE